MEERLQKIMARAGLGSRRDNEALIAAGRVRVNGRPATLGQKADPAVDLVEVDGRPLQPADGLDYVILHKPRGVLSSTEDEMGRGRATVRDLVPLPGHLYPVGRLDRQSEGLMLLTNDGDLAHRLTHPRYGHQKLYRVLVEGRIAAASLQQWRDGLLLDGRPTAPAAVAVVGADAGAVGAENLPLLQVPPLYPPPTADHTWLQVRMGEGRKRQIRRIAALLGHPVLQLIREAIGPLQLGDLPAGAWRHLTPAEVADLRAHADRPPRSSETSEVSPPRPPEHQKVKPIDPAIKNPKSKIQNPRSQSPAPPHRHRRPGRVRQDNRRPDAGRKA